MLLSVARKRNKRPMVVLNWSPCLANSTTSNPPCLRVNRGCSQLGGLQVLVYEDEYEDNYSKVGYRLVTLDNWCEQKEDFGISREHAEMSWYKRYDKPGGKHRNAAGNRCIKIVKDEEHTHQAGIRAGTRRENTSLSPRRRRP